jgi:hypothetical protein
MHTAIVVALGFGLLAACGAVGRVMGGAAGFHRAMLVFLPLWLIGAAVNMAMGVKKAGYSVAEEFPIFLVVFAIPAAVAMVLWWRIR